jgi:hypothetical protein
MLDNLLFQITETINTLRETFLKCLSVFLIWFVTIFAIGLGILATLKLLEIYFL